jgi:type I restriction enzyme S subunit
MTTAKQNLPSGWIWTTLGALSDKPQYGWTTKANPEAGTVKLLRTTDITSGTLDWSRVPYCSENPDDLDKYLVQTGDIVISRAGSVGFSYLLSHVERAVFASYLIRFRIKHSINKQYVYYYLKSPAYWEAIGASQAGIAVPNVNAKKLERVQIPVAPEPQQDRIVAEIEKQFSRLDEAVASLKRVKANLKRYKAAVLKAAVEGKLVPIQNGQTRKIGEVAEIVTKGSSPNWQGFDYSENGIVFVRSQNVGWGDLDLSDVAHLPAEFNKKERKSVLKAGDVLLNIVGASIGRAAVATVEIEGGNVNQAVAVIRLNPKYMLPMFLVLHLLSPTAQAAIYAEKVDVARANVSLGDIKEFLVPLPSLAEQESIVAEVERRLSVIEELDAAVEANLNRADRLRQRILQDAFSGKLGVLTISTNQP